MNRIIETFSEFKTEDYLPENWVKKVWIDNGFLTYVPFPTEYDVFLEEVNVSDLLNDFLEALNNWFRLSGTSLENVIENYSNSDAGCSQECELSWQTLISEGINYKALICICGTLIQRFLDESTNSVFFKEALHAIRLYFLFVAIPGSHVCQIFNSTLYSHVMSVIKICCEQIDGSGGAKKGVKRKKDDNEDGAETDDQEPNRLSYDTTTLILSVSDFLANLKCIVENKKLKLDDTSLNLTGQILLMITRLEKIYSTVLNNDLQHMRKDTVSYLASKSFNVLLCMSGVMHSNPYESAKMIVKLMLPIFLVGELRNLGLSMKDSSIVRTNCTFFLKQLLDTLGETAYEAINILVQRICAAVPERAEMRLKASIAVLDILKISPPDLLAEEMYSIVFMSHMTETKIRLFTLEIIGKLLLENETNISFTRLPQKYAAVTNEKFLLATIFYRCQDVSVGIRTKALSYLDQFITNQTSNRRVKRLMDEIFVEPYENVENPEEMDAYHREIFDTQQYLLEERFLDDRSLNPLPGVKVILDMLLYFSQEDKVFIKKCAIQTLAKILLFNKLWIRPELLQVFLIGCDDPSVLVRKTMGQILTDLVSTYPDNLDIVKCWVEGVVPMIAEEEVKAQEKVIEHFTKVILNNIMVHEHTNSIVSRLPWMIMSEILLQDKRSYLHFAVGKWIQNNAAKGKLTQMIYTHVDTENNDVAWCLLVSFAQFTNLPNPEIFLAYYERVLPNLEAAPHNQLVLEVLYHVSSNLSKDQKSSLLTKLECGLVGGEFPLKLIARSRDICELLVCSLAGSKKNTHSAVLNWSAPKITMCMDYVKECIGPNAPVEIVNVEKLMKCIFLLGELAQAAPTYVSKSDIRMLENLLLSPRKRESNAWKGRACNALKAVDVLTLVKLVLQKEETANSIMPIFREILSSNSIDPIIQVNTIIGMCDLCSRYTTLVERYFNHICKCFNSKHENVRMTALKSVIKRIKEEYVKLRPFILFPMLTMIMDGSVAVKRIMANFIGIDLKKKNNILETFYVGLFFFLNNCKNHSTTVKIPDDLRTLFSLTDKPEDREYIYTYVLDKLADASKRLLVCKKITVEIFGAVADETLKLDEKTENIVSDAFNVMIDNERKIYEAISHSKRGANDDAEEIEELNEGTTKDGKKTQITITEAIRLNEANEMMPVIIKLRSRLKKEKSRCSNNLMSYMCELTKNYTNEINDMLNNDVEMKTEIAYNLRRLEQDEARRRAESVETSDSMVVGVEHDDEHRQIDVLVPTNPAEVCEQLENLIIQLERCDQRETTTPSQQPAAITSPVKLGKNSAAASPQKVAVDNVEERMEVEQTTVAESRPCLEERMEVEESDAADDQKRRGRKETERKTRCREAEITEKEERGRRRERKEKDGQSKRMATESADESEERDDRVERKENRSQRSRRREMESCNEERRESAEGEIIEQMESPKLRKEVEKRVDTEKCKSPRKNAKAVAENERKPSRDEEKQRVHKEGKTHEKRSQKEPSPSKGRKSPKKKVQTEKMRKNAEPYRNTAKDQSPKAKHDRIPRDRRKSANSPVLECEVSDKEVELRNALSEKRIANEPQMEDEEGWIENDALVEEGPVEVGQEQFSSDEDNG